MADNGDIYWLAGLLEGEGSFTIGRHHGQNGRVYKQPKISLVMTDADVVARAAHIMGTRDGFFSTLPSGKHAYRTIAYGPRCIGWVLTLYGLMGRRRQEQIRAIVQAWRESPGRSRVQRKNQLQPVVTGLLIEV